jgi:hypothetical protein
MRSNANEVDKLYGLDSIITANKFSIFRQPPLISVRLLQSAFACAIAFHIRDAAFQVTTEHCI